MVLSVESGSDVELNDCWLTWFKSLDSSLGGLALQLKTDACELPFLHFGSWGSVYIKKKKKKESSQILSGYSSTNLLLFDVSFIPKTFKSIADVILIIKWSLLHLKVT